MYSKLKALREKRGLTIEEMANIIKKSPCNYFKKEKGKVKFSVNEALEISKRLNTKVEKIFFEDDVSDNETKRRTDESY